MDLRIASRGSDLALCQAELVADSLRLRGFAVLVETYKTMGDKILDRRLSEIGGKSLFTKEIDEAVLRGDADLAVHSMKDMETELHSDLAIGAVLERGDERDAFVSFEYESLSSMPAGAIVGTASLRRRSQILHYYPHLRVESLRGNVGSRLSKLRSGECGGTLLAVAGLHRLGLEHEISSILGVDEMLPAVGQGALAVMCRRDNSHLLESLESLHDNVSYLRVMAERSFLRALDGSCRTPIGALAEVRGAVLHIAGMLASEDGVRLCRASCESSLDLADAESVSHELGLSIRREYDG